MTLDDMIAVLEAAKRGEKIEWMNYASKSWDTYKFAEFNFVDYEYRIAPKKEMTLVEELRTVCPEGMTRKLRERAADRIEELEKIAFTLEHRPTDELLAEIARRVK